MYYKAIVSFSYIVPDVSNLIINEIIRVGNSISQIDSYSFVFFLKMVS